MQIPIKNLYYLLCYAWDKLDQGKQVDVSLDGNASVLDLFVKVLAVGTKRIVNRGLQKDYVMEGHVISGIKGKLDLGETTKRNLLKFGKTHCAFDNYTSNILINQIIYTTICNLIQCREVSKKDKAILLKLKVRFDGVDRIELRKKHFEQVQINRNNKFYGFIINVCQFIYEQLLPGEEPGSFEFADFIRDKYKMNRLYEAFILNFYKKEQKRFTTVKSEQIKWKFDASNDLEHIPVMKTDISLWNRNEKIIIDAKFYKETMSSFFGKEKVKSANLYQLFSYLINQEKSTDPKTLSATGILLYPTIEKEYDIRYRFGKHQIEIRTLNLNTDWKDIEKRLLEIVSEHRPQVAVADPLNLN